MTKEERRKFLRERLIALKGPSAVLPAGKRRKPPVAPRPKPNKIVMPWPEIEGNARRLPKFMREFLKPKIPIPAPKRRRKGEAALVRVARKLLLKLPRVKV